MRRKYLAAAAFVVAALISSIASAQFAPIWSHGPTIPLYSIRWDENGQATSAFLAEGAGYSFNANMLPSADGRWRYLTASLAMFLQAPQAEGLGFSIGIPIGTLNNLLAVGPVFDMAKFGDVDTGLLVGNFTKENVGLLVSFNLNFGSGTSAAPMQAAKAYQAPPTPPPNYVKFW